ncbi:thermonuclease family protein [Streptomyces sp. Da 82-17]|uniref:thermonuclease family protein n=1 Tax=Streptomyces sp. Da 82-17 TaxID=3377116 RepID=UPI0038D4BB69
MLVACFVALVGLGIGLSGGGTGDSSSPASSSSDPAVPSTPTPTSTPPAPPSGPAGPADPAGPSDPAPQRSRRDAPAPRPEATVVRVVDGDTLDVRGDGDVLPAGEVVRVRLLAIDAPEKGACFAEEATARLTELLPPGSALRYERDVDLKDPYDRYLLYLFDAQGVFVNASLVETGHAEARLYPPNDARWPEISRDGAEAESTATGLWAACPEPEPNSPAEPSPPDEPAPEPQPVQPDNPDVGDPDAGDPDGLPPGPPAGAPDVDCRDVPGPVRVGPDDPHRLDADGDGIGCDS